MKSDNIIAVITGDLVKSSKLNSDEIISVIGLLKKIFNDLNQYIFIDEKSKFEIFRGDSFQGIIPQPEKSLLAAIIIRAGLRSFIPEKYHKIKSVKFAYTDVRIAIGIGDVSFLSKKVVESQGTAFIKSGRLLDRLVKQNDRLGIGTSRKNLNEEFFVESKLADALISRWTPATAEAVYYYLLYNKTQAELADLLRISQPAVNKRLVSYGNIKNINVFIKRFFDLIKEQY